MAVSGIWLLLMLGILMDLLNPESWKLVIAILMGGSVVGIAYQGEKVIKWAAQKPMLWKMLVLPPGFLAVYGAVQYMSFWTFGGAVIVLAATAYLFFIRRGVSGTPHTAHLNDASNVQKIEKGLEQCC